MPKTKTALKRALAELTALHPKKIDLGLGRIQSVLDALGNPERHLPKSVHIAGTNGKGSTTALLRAMCEAAGQSVHVYTSPHLVRFNERIVVGSKEIGDAALLDVITRVRRANGDAPLSFFEATTAAAFLAFSESPADVALIEVGLGGRYDATNVFDAALCAITPIHYDHAEFLGRDLAGIAKEKAGIMRAHTPVHSAPQSDLVRAVLDAQAGNARAPIQHQGQDFRSYRQHGRLVYETENTVLDLPLPALRGEHQITNAGLAISLALELGLDEKAIAKGLTEAKWPARMQALRKGPLVDMVREEGAELWLDGGHNPHAARALAQTMAGLDELDPRPLILVMGILANKDAGGYLDYFDGLASGLIALNIPDHSSLSPEILVELGEARNLISITANNPTDAVQKAVNMGSALSRETVEQPLIAPRILICGSLYLAGVVLAENG